MRIKNIIKATALVLALWVTAPLPLLVLNAQTNVPAATRPDSVGGRPVLSITQSGPETLAVGSEAVYQMVIKNIGSAVAQSVVVTNRFPAGLSHGSGKNEVVFQLGELQPDQSKPVTVTLKVTQRGNLCNRATVYSANAAEASAESCTMAWASGLKVQQTGPKEQILMRNAEFEILVTNTGERPLSNITLSNAAPPDTAIVAAPGAIISGNSATWTIATLAAGAKVTQTIRLTSKVAGTHCNTASASTSGVSDSNSLCTVWKGIAAALFEVVDDPDPIQVGESTTYKIKVFNQGFASLHNVKVEAVFDDLVSPVSADQGTVRGQSVSFPIVAALGAKQSITYTITVKGAGAGDSRNAVTLTATELKTPVVEEESTTVY